MEQLNVTSTTTYYLITLDNCLTDEGHEVQPVLITADGNAAQDTAEKLNRSLGYIRQKPQLTDKWNKLFGEPLGVYIYDVLYIPYIFSVSPVPGF